MSGRLLSKRCNFCSLLINTVWNKIFKTNLISVYWFFRYDWGCFMQDLRSQFVEKNRDRRGEEIDAFIVFFASE